MFPSGAAATGAADGFGSPPNRDVLKYWTRGIIDMFRILLSPRSRRIVGQCACLILLLVAQQGVTNARAREASRDVVEHRHAEAALQRSLPAPPIPADVTRWRKSEAARIKAKARTKAVLLKPAASRSLLAAVDNQREYAAAPGADSTRRTLVLYDTDGPWGWLGEAYAVMAGNLASNRSRYVLRPVAAYQPGELFNYTGAIYIGSVYDQPLPTSFLDDVLSGSRPVLWMFDNIWQLAQRSGSFAGTYGWAPGTFDFTCCTRVRYRGAELVRDPATLASGLLTVSISDPAKATVLAMAFDAGSGKEIVWATRSGNLTYIGDLPFSYVGPDDRYLAAVNLISELADPNGPDRKRALVRIEDVGPNSDPAALRAIADYLFSRNAPFSVAVYPLYVDPYGLYNDGRPQTITLLQAPRVVSALKYMRSKGGTLLLHGYTHQHSNVLNPYSGVSADDFEFYRAHVDASNRVIYDGPVQEDSASWAQGRINAALMWFILAGLPSPTIFEFPHYAGSAIDYQVVQQKFGKRYDRPIIPANWCPGGNCGTGIADYSRIYGQYFPYLVRDVYGSVVIPESLGNIEPEPFNQNPARLVPDILATARNNEVVRDRTQSFFFHPYLNITYLKELVEGIQGMGYTFVSVAEASQ